MRQEHYQDNDYLVKPSSLSLHPSSLPKNSTEFFGLGATKNAGTDKA
jgi:hypothetical protein